MKLRTQLKRHFSNKLFKINTKIISVCVTIKVYAYTIKRRRKRSNEDNSIFRRICMSFKFMFHKIDKISI